MLIRLLRESFRREKRQRAAAIAAVALGTSLVTALFSVVLDIGDKMGRELRSFGANLIMLPQSEALTIRISDVDYRPLSNDRFIRQDDLTKIKDIFWRHNVITFAPWLDLPARFENGMTTTLIGTWFNKPFRTKDGETFAVGMKPLRPWWNVEGAWATDEDLDAAMIGEDLARRMGLKPGDRFRIYCKIGERETPLQLLVRGIVSSGGEEDQQVFASLARVQTVVGLHNKVRTVQISALTKPEDGLAKKDPKKMTPEEYDAWYCSPYVSSISFQLKESIPGTEVKPIRRVVETEGVVLGKIKLIVLLVTLASLAAVVLTVASTMTTTVLQRKIEIGLMKAIGASNGNVLMIFFMEALLMGLIGGVLGFALGGIIAQAVGQSVFSSSISPKFVLLPIMLITSGLVTVLASIFPLRSALSIEPAQVLHGK